MNTAVNAFLSGGGPAFVDAAEVLRVPLVGGRHALIDAADAPLVCKYRWYPLPTPTGRFYAKTEIDGRIVYMHRLIANTPDGMTTDHANNDGLDNRRSNLRIASWTQNIANTEKQPTRAGKPTTSQYKGVSWDRARKKWAASAKLDGRYTYLGRYDSEAEAARAYDSAVFEAYGEFAVLNFPDHIDEPTPYQPGRKRETRSHCPQGHEYTRDNSRTNSRGYRVCVTCRRASDLASWRRRRDAARAQAVAA